MQGRIPIVRLGVVDPRAGLAQQLDAAAVRVARHRREVQRRLAKLIPHGHRGAGVEEQTADLDLLRRQLILTRAAARDDVEARVADAVLRVQLRLRRARL